ncbi:cytochrome P450 alkane hydroxylase like protein [Zymoseptoria brevis]|uniref:Cytochrome P450 alkane hydroxylase like protein n=1 Tax=Zymoseptoria brevis TaxID=1047168 RepID=A0A0F4GNM8_9PEZI|nr:cytochrome P450 alkane hydroxylase like protein [Zymoseptoria brevis]
MANLTKLSATAQLATAIACLYIFYLLTTTTAIWLRRRSYKRSKGVMSAARIPAKDPIMGIDLFLRNIRALKEHTLLELGTARFANLKANTIRGLGLGREIHVTIEPENLKTIQAVDFKKWGLGTGRKTGFHPLLGQGIFTSEGPDWQHSRDMLRPNFVRSQIGDTVTFEKHISHLVAAIPKDGTTVNLSDLFFRLTIDSATEFLFGESTESLTKDSTDGFAEALNNGQDFIAKKARWGKWARFAIKNKRFEADRKFVHDFVDYYVDKGLAKRAQLLAEDQKPQRYVFIDELVRQTTDRVRIRSELLNVLIAGRDTTASLLTNVWFILSKRPDIWAKLQSEVGQLNGVRPTFEQLKDLKYLQSVLSESLRLHPVVPLNSREAQCDTTLPVGGGPSGLAPIFIPKGGVVSWNVYAMHRRKDIYGPDAEDFTPERWLDDPETGKKGLRPGWGYLPFNGGPRVCLGQQFALTEASYATVRLCQAFSGIASRDPEEWKEFLMLNCVSLNGAKVKLTPREG